MNRVVQSSLISEIYLPISDIHIPLKRKRYPYNEVYEVLSFIGYDSETYQGACKLLCDSKGSYVLNPTFYDCLDFLIDYPDDNSHRCFWNLDFDLSAIFKLYPYDNDKVDRLFHGYTEQFKNYEITYLRPKFLVIKKGKIRKVFTDLFYIFRTSLNVASKKYIKDEKLDKIDGNMLNKYYSYWKENEKDIIEYCIKDCVLVEKLGIFFLENVKRANLPIPKFLSSHASLSKEIALSMCKIPSIRWIPENILDIACQTYYGGRFEILSRGFFENLFVFDINSAYPRVIAELPSFKYGKWKRVFEASKKEKIGFYKVSMVIPETRISPFILKYKGVCCFPSGVFETWITWYEYDLCKEYITKFHYGYEYFPSEREYYPFKKMIDKLYALKSKYKYGSDKWNKRLFFKENKELIDEVLSWIYKIVMNALYGCFIERNYDIEQDLTFAGKLFNPVNATIITAKVRWQLLNSVKKRHWKYLQGFHTDSLFTTKKLRELKVNRKIGNWSLEKSGKALLLMSGVYQVGTTTRNRGFSTKKDDKLKDNEQGSYIDWFELMELNAQKTEIEFNKMRVYKMNEVLKRFDNLTKVNTFYEAKKKLNINADHKRSWKRDFENCYDLSQNLIESTTMKLKFIRNDGLK